MTFISGYILLLDACKSQIFVVIEFCAILKEYTFSVQQVAWAMCSVCSVQTGHSLSL